MTGLSFLVNTLNLMTTKKGYIFLVMLTIICMILFGFKHLRSIGQLCRATVVPDDIISAIAEPEAWMKAPKLKHSNYTSYFVYRVPEKLELISFINSCIHCPVKCPHSLPELSSCKGVECLCFQLNPVQNFPKYFDNSVVAKEPLLPGELQTFDDEPISDKGRIPNSTTSKTVVLSSANVGKDIKIQLQLYDSYGEKVLRGADDVRVRLVDDVRKLSQAGRVTDYKNGTYLLTLRTSFPGKIKVLVYIPHFREEWSTYLRWLRHFNTIFYYKSVYRRGNETQSTLCGPRPNIPGYDVVCNITYENGDDLWFCGAPPSQNLSCEDLNSVHDYRLIDIGITPGEEFLAKRRGWMDAFKEVTVNVKGKAIPDNRNLLPTCNKLPKSKTWDLSSPTGYALNGEYHPSYCRITKTRNDIKRCLTNTTLFFTGDSTTRQWFMFLTSYLNCSLTTEKWYTRKWQRYAQCQNKHINLTIHLHPHNLPFSLAERHPGQTRMRLNSIGMVFDKVPSKGKTIFVIYLFGHLTRHHYYISREKFRNMIPGLRRALARNKDMYVLIKSPHWFVQSWIIAVNDYSALFIKQLIMEEFKEFRQQIVYLDYWDMSSAYANTEMHPPNPMLFNMLRLLFGYACP